MFLNRYISVTLNQMGLIQDGETVYFLKLLEEKPTVCPTSVLAPLKLQVSSSKPASEGARVSRAPEAGRVDGKDGVVTSHTPHFQVKGSLSFPLVKYLLGVLATIYIHHNYRVGKKVQLKAQI